MRKHSPTISCSLAIATALLAANLGNSGCAPVTAKTTTVADAEQSLLESLVLAHHNVFTNTEALAENNDFALTSDDENDWPQSGSGTVQIGDSFVSLDFNVDRTDYTTISREWTVSLGLNPLMVDNTRLVGTAAGTWSYWEEEQNGTTMGWCRLDILGAVTRDDDPTVEEMVVVAVVSDTGLIWEAEALLGAESWSVVPE